MTCGIQRPELGKVGSKIITRLEANEVARIGPSGG